MDKKYFIIVSYNFKKTMLDVREISHVTTSVSKDVDTSTVYMKNGKDIEVNDDEFFSELKRIEEELKPRD
ncbi:hypothetical protein [Chryseobacterium defluvii]|uniref:Uncharacterized protein n=1 Tax=Chryseobacterium defluvii TaxID=160396 RepID=A0A495SM12_9FLAO|nr:hypothetical protein [Chryseobacterium defluvii]RKT01087.1 hypothetical protein BCF58_0301 [Chryseobacterium defluvii]